MDADEEEWDKESRFGPRVTSHPRLVSFDGTPIYHRSSPAAPPARGPAKLSNHRRRASSSSVLSATDSRTNAGRAHSTGLAELSPRRTEEELRGKELYLALTIVFLKELRDLSQNRALVTLTMARAMGSLPINALAFMVLWFQYAGLSDFGAGVSVAFAALGTIVGCVLGGHIGDRASVRNPDRGRITVAQVTQLVLCVFMIALIKFIPQDDSSIFFFIGITMIIGMLLAFPAFACDLPILAEVVPWRLRGTAYALSGLFLGLFSSIGSVMVGLIADKIFHYRTRTEEMDSISPGDKQHNLDALSNAILLLFLSSWILVFFIYFVVARYYPSYRDKASGGAYVEPVTVLHQSSSLSTSSLDRTRLSHTHHTLSSWFTVTRTAYFDAHRHVPEANQLIVFGT